MGWGDREDEEGGRVGGRGRIGELGRVCGCGWISAKPGESAEGQAQARMQLQVSYLERRRVRQIKT